MKRWRHKESVPGSSRCPPGTFSSTSRNPIGTAFCRPRSRRASPSSRDRCSDGSAMSEPPAGSSAWRPSAPPRHLRSCNASSASSPSGSSQSPRSCSDVADADREHGQKWSETKMVDRQNQLREGESGAPADSTVAAPPCAMVIFGAAGDLTKCLVVPALYDLVCAKRLPERFRLVGVDLAAKTSADWRAALSEMMNQFVAHSGGEVHVDQLDQAAWRWLTDRMTYLQGDLNDPGTYRRLRDHLAGLDETAGTAGNYLFYLAVADRFFSVAISGLGAAGLADEKAGRWRRVVIEKPFGHDLASGRALNADILKTLDERQIYRIDHFLGKETVQNVMALRFANGIFEPIWNRAHIDHIQITAAETVGVERRGRFYERTG